MYKKRYLIALIAVSMLLSLVAACTAIMPLPQQAHSSISAGTEQVKGHLTVLDGRIFEYEILVPQSWTGKYEIREVGNIAFFDYNASPKNTLFSIAAFTEAQWQEVQQEPGHGTELLSQDGIVSIYNVALDNPYTGSQAKEFQQMAGQVKSVVGTLTVSTTLTLTDMEKAQSTPTPVEQGIANPASENCIQQGGNLEMYTRGELGEYGVCVFDGNRQCEEWALFRGDCPDGGVDISGYVTTAAAFCAITGGEYTITGNSGTPDEQGTCVSRTNEICDLWAYYNGECDP